MKIITTSNLTRSGGGLENAFFFVNKTGFRKFPVRKSCFETRGSRRKLTSCAHVPMISGRTKPGILGSCTHDTIYDFSQSIFARFLPDYRTLNQAGIFRGFCDSGNRAMNSEHQGCLFENSRCLVFRNPSTLSFIENGSRFLLRAENGPNVKISVFPSQFS